MGKEKKRRGNRGEIDTLESPKKDSIRQQCFNISNKCCTWIPIFFSASLVDCGPYDQHQQKILINKSWLFSHIKWPGKNVIFGVLVVAVRVKKPDIGSLKMQLGSLASLSGLRILHCSTGHRRSLESALLQSWHKPEAVAPIWPLT